MLNAKASHPDSTNNIDISQYEEYKQFEEAMDDDLNTSKALAVLFDLANKANKDVPYAYTILRKLAETLGFTFEKSALSEEEIKNILNNINAELKSNYNSIEEIIDQRNSARADKNWEMADQIRIVLDKYGIVLKDSKEGTIWETKA